MKIKIEAGWMAFFTPASPSTAICAPFLTPPFLVGRSRSAFSRSRLIKAYQAISRHIKDQMFFPGVPMPLTMHCQSEDKRSPTRFTDNLPGMPNAISKPRAESDPVRDQTLVLTVQKQNSQPPDERHP
jgi:hypothetical protein